MDFTRIVFDLIDMRSFSNLWYWIALAVVWSSASHWVIGVPYDIVLRARRMGGQFETDLQDILRVNVNRILYVGRVAGPILLALVSFFLTTLAILGFWYRVEFCQAVFLLALPMSVVAVMSLSTAKSIDAAAHGGTPLTGAALHRRLSVHRIWVQLVGMVSIFVTAFWGMLQNFSVSILGG